MTRSLTYVLASLCAGAVWAQGATAFSDEDVSTVVAGAEASLDDTSTAARPLEFPIVWTLELERAGSDAPSWVFADSTDDDLILRREDGGAEIRFAARPVEGAAGPGGRVGALIRFGEGLSAPRSEDERGGWYFFAGGDAQAVTWRMGEGVRAQSGGVRFEEIAMVGDAQAGVTRRIGSGDLTLGVIHREVRHAGASADEQFGGLSFVISR